MKRNSSSISNAANASSLWTSGLRMNVVNELVSDSISIFRRLFSLKLERKSNDINNLTKIYPKFV